MNNFDINDDFDLEQETEKLAKNESNSLLSLLIVISTILVSLFSFILVKSEYGVALGLLTPIAITLAVLGLVIYFKDIY